MDHASRRPFVLRTSRLRARRAPLLFALGGISWAMAMSSASPASPVSPASSASSVLAPTDFVPYQVTRESSVYAHLPDTAIEVDPGLGDGGSLRVDLPFDFFLFGVPHRTVYINANGFISMTALAEHAQVHVPPARTPHVGAPAGFVAPLWADWCASRTESGQCASSGSAHQGVFYDLGGEPGRRHLRVEWRGVRLYQHDEVPGSADFSATLYEGLASQIDFDYGTFVPGEGGSGTGDFAARMGVESSDEQVGFWASPCADYAACTESDVALLSGQRIRLVADAGPDVGIDTVVLDPIIYPGTVSVLGLNLINRHGEPTSPLDLRVSWIAAASDGVGLPDERLGQTISVPGLDAFEVRRRSTRLEVPADLSPGRYRVTVRVDESSFSTRDVYEANNVSTALGEVSVVEARADFRVIEVGVRIGVGTPLAPSASFDLDFLVENKGLVDGVMDLAAVVSPNRAITLADRPIGELQPFRLKRGTRAGGRLRATLPDDLEPGDYYVGLLVNTGLVTPEVDVANNVGRSPDTISVRTEEVTFDGRTLPSGAVGRAERWTLHAVGGAGVFQYSVVDGVVPTGLLLSREGVLEGTPEREGTYVFDVRAAGDGLGRMARFELAIEAPAMPLAMVSRQLPTAVVGREFGAPILAVGGRPPYHFSTLVSGVLPPGLTLDDQGSLQGVPTASGVWSFEVIATDSMGEQVTATLRLEVRHTGALLIASSDLGEVMLGEPMAAVLYVEDHEGEVEWRPLVESERTAFDVSSELLDGEGVPHGLTLSPDGRLFGVPSMAGCARFVVEAADDRGHIDRALVWINVLPDAAFRFETSILPDGVAWAYFRAVVTTSGGASPITWRVVDDHKPPGMTLRVGRGEAAESEDDFVLEGTLEREGVWSLTLEARDGRGRMRTQPFAIVSRAPSEERDTPTSANQEPRVLPPASCRCILSPGQHSSAGGGAERRMRDRASRDGSEHGSDRSWGWMIALAGFVIYRGRARGRRGLAQGADSNRGI